MKKNNAIYNNKKTIERYKKLNYTLKPEQVIIDFISNLDIEKRGKIIDIGVGAGRTTNLFHKYFTHYIGIDYAQEMINYCNSNYRSLNNTKFIKSDARKMNFAHENSVDFSFFSFNGIDCVEFSDRIKILKEIIRIGKKDSYFAFSTHNLFNINKLFKFQTPKNPFKWLKEYQRYKGIKEHNNIDYLRSRKDYAYIFDGDNNNFNFKYTYIDPKYQVENLEEMGFEIIKIIDLSGNSLDVINTNWEEFSEPWIHFLCSIKK